MNNFAVNTPDSVAKLRTSVFRGPLLVLLPDHQNWCTSLVLVNIKFYIGYDAQTLYLERILPVELKTIPLEHQHEGHAHTSVVKLICATFGEREDVGIQHGARLGCSCLY